MSRAIYGYAGNGNIGRDIGDAVRDPLSPIAIDEYHFCRV